MLFGVFTVLTRHVVPFIWLKDDVAMQGAGGGGGEDKLNSNGELPGEATHAAYCPFHMVEGRCGNACEGGGG